VCGLALSAGNPGPVPVARPPGKVAAPSGRAVPAADPDGGQRSARPVLLVIPAIGISARIIRLGTTAAGTLRVPASTTVAGWYRSSPPPGAIGSSVIAGHVDSRSGPGVFFRLDALRPGDRIYVRRADGTLAVFAVQSRHRYAKDRFPARTIYGPTAGAQLRLITCGGAFDPALRSYLANVVVYAALVSRGQ
jgi:sortase (surface protein transpeptidase)